MTLRAALLVSVVCASTALGAQPSAEQVCTEVGLSAKERERVVAGEYVTCKVDAVSERDLSFAVAFVVKTSPDAITKQVVEGAVVADDPQVQAYGMLDAPVTLASFAGLRITADEGRALTSSEPGEGVNLSAEEHAAFKALRGAATETIQEQLRKILLARYQSYRASGLDGIAPYARTGGAILDVAPDLRKAVQSATLLQKHVPALYGTLLDYPHSTIAGMKESFLWMKAVVRDKPTYVLAHIVSAGEGEARAVVRREFYVSTGYNAEQTAAGLLPVAGGTMVTCLSHAFSDQVAGSGGAMKRSIGSRMMAAQMREIFETGRKRMER